MSFTEFHQRLNDHLVEMGLDVLSVKEARKEYQLFKKEEASKRRKRTIEGILEPLM